MLIAILAGDEPPEPRITPAVLHVRASTLSRGP
jgi:hypothetical protein